MIYLRSISFITFPVVQKFTDTLLVLGSIAFELFNLGETLWVALRKLPTISWVNFGPFLRQSWCNSVRFVGLLARSRVFSSAHKFSMGLRSGLCDGHSNTLTLLALSHFATTLEVCLGGIVHLEDPFATKLKLPD